MPGDEEEDFAALFAASEQGARTRRVSAGDVVRGRIVALGTDAAFVAIGAKAEAIIDLGELRAPDGALSAKVGDEIEATVVDDGRRSGSIVLRRTLGRGGGGVAELEQAMAHGVAVEGLVTGQNKGGFDVQIGGVRAFCPASQIDLRRGEPEKYLGQRLRFRVTRIESNGRNVVVGRRALLADEESAAAARAWERLAVGATVRGRVSSLRDFGAFVEIGGVEGLVHVSELGHGRVSHPSEVLAVGQEVEVQVVSLEPGGEGGRGRIGLSLRALAPDPWHEVAARFPVGTTVRGTVRRLETFGAFVELAPGVEGLAHVSKLVLDRRISHPRQAVSPGQEVDVTVVQLDLEKRRIGLSMVERARSARDAAEDAERREVEAALAPPGGGASLGTLADLLKPSQKKKER